MAIKIDPPEPDSPDARILRREKRAFWRLTAWGGAAALSLAALGVTLQTEAGSERLALAFAGAAPRSIDVAALEERVLEKDAETKALEIQMRAVVADRDRLGTRIASLEHSLDDVTGSIKRQAAANAAVTPPATTASVTADAKIAPPAAPGPNVVRTEKFTPPPPPAIAAPQAAAPAAEPVPMPPTRVASAPTAEPAADAPHKNEFGVDLGGAHDVDILNARWAAVKANFGPLLNGLYPLATHDRRPGSTDLRLLAGPVANPAAANALCAKFAAVRVTCRTVKFDGERLVQR
jgi:hypothetical protein